MSAPPEPFYFGPEARPLLGLLHRPLAPPSHGLGLVVCNPFGYESICAHRSLRHLAVAAANASIPTLRFDYDGSGNSAGADWDPARLAAWVASVQHAIDALRQSAGASQVALVGLRLGAAVATLAALGRDDVAGIGAIAPVTSGRAYVRELRALQLALHLAAPPPDARQRADGEVQEAIGFVLTAETRAALTAVDVLALPRRPASAMLVLDREDFPPSTKWLAHLEGLGVAVEHRQLPGYPDMMLDPHKTKVPKAMIAATVEWASRLSSKVRRSTAPPAERTEAARNSLAVPRGVAHFVEGDVALEERVVDMGDDTPLFAVVTSPLEPSTTPRKAVLWLNAGSVAHVGPNRMAVALARRWASRGYVVVRMDISGIGESPARSGESENVVYTERSREDTAAAIAYVKRLGVSECHAIGLCSGAYNAFKGAAAGQALDGIVLVNPAVFFWKPGMTLDFEYRDARVNREATRYRRAAFDSKTWIKIAQGKVKLRPFVQVVSRRAASVAAAGVREVARRVGRPMKDDLPAELLAIAKRRIPMFFVFAAGDPGLHLLESEGGATVRKLRHDARLKLAVLEGPDHTFTPLWAQEKLAAVLDDHFFGP